MSIDVEFVRKGGREGHTTVDRTVQAFNTVGPQLIHRLYSVYKIDFDVFVFSLSRSTTSAQLECLHCS
jgi:hypothetical protein